MKTYEDYWRLTNAFTDYNGIGFLTILKICVEFIDEFSAESYSEKKYARLQSRIESHSGLNLISVRKAINQLVKMGFINSFLASYNFDSVAYIQAKTNKKRQSLLSKIIYSNASFNRSVNENSSLHQINFLIKTLIENGKISKEEIIALMIVEIDTIKKGYLNASELAFYVQKAQEMDFIERKYNQVAYLYNLLSKLDDLVFVKDELYFEEDAKVIFGDDLKDERKVRDPYLHRLYKNQLKEESTSILGDTKCMVEKLAYPVLIASHIKPFIKSDDNEAYDANNGILLSKNMDALFDLGYISFDNSGIILFAEKLSDDVKTFVSNYQLDTIFLNQKRIQYLEYHRKEVFNQKFAS